MFSHLVAPGRAAAAAGAAPSRLLQRACACAGKGPCPECEKKKRLQRRADPQGAQAAAPRAALPAPVESDGVPLPAPLRARFAPLLGSDFGAVRLHHDAASDAAARGVGARAFTVGQHVHFAAGEYRPQTKDGLHLLAHELSHTVQQAGAPPLAMAAPAEGYAVDGADSPLEREADAAADAALAGRRAQVGRGSAARVQARLLQRKPTGIGSAGGGSETASIERVIDENTTVYITRTVTEAPCRPVDKTEKTPADQIFYWDSKADAVGMQYRICRGRIQLGTKGEIDYSKAVESATGLLKTLQGNPALGGDLGKLLDDRLQAAKISASGSVTLEVDGILRAELTGDSTVGSGAQSYAVRGSLLVTPRGVSFKIAGGIDYAKTPLDSKTTYTLESTVATKRFAVSLKYQQIDSSAVGGPASSRGEFTGGLDIPLTKDITLGPTVTVEPGGKPNFGFGAKGTFGGPAKAPEVRCYECRCPPPQPEYSCRRDTRAHEKRVKTADPKDAQVKLLYQYNSTAPAKGGDFQAAAGSVASMLGEGYAVTQIHGYASPEGSLDAPKKPVAGFKGNIALSQARADHARGAIAKLAPQATLPAAEGRGERLGDLDGSGDTADADLAAKLAALLEPLGEEQRLDVLGVPDSVKADAERRAQALADIQAFVSGRDARGLALAQRPRWEKVFPFLRRVEVALHKPATFGQVPVAASSTKGCDDADLAYAKSQMPPLPPERRLPKESCDPRARP
ncbi:MAG: DUF4157 domain-containing protein [Rubrivivax sp.]|nr:DUF4157 domain-containing protein [Rubrivivax sp.]